MWTDQDEQAFLRMLERRDAHVRAAQRPVEVIVNRMYPMVSFEARQRLVLNLINNARDLRVALKNFDPSKAL